MEFTTKVDLLETCVYVNEIKVKHFKILLKTLLGNEPDINSVYINILNVLENVTNLTKLQLEQLSVIDFLLLIIHIRCISIGSNIQLEVKDIKNTKLTLNLNKVIENLKIPLQFNFKPVIEDIKIEYQLPRIKDFLFNQTTNSSLLPFKGYIKSIIFKNIHIQVSALSDSDFLNLINSLPAKHSSIIFNDILNLLVKINNLNLLNHITNKNIFLYLNQDAFIFILQILFSKNLLPLYENIFALAKFANLSPSYIEECTPGEYTIFVKTLERILKEQNAQQSTNTLPPINKDKPDFL